MDGSEFNRNLRSASEPANHLAKPHEAPRFSSNQSLKVHHEVIQSLFLIMRALPHPSWNRVVHIRVPAQHSWTLPFSGVRVRQATCLNLMRSQHWGLRMQRRVVIVCLSGSISDYAWPQGQYPDLILRSRVLIYFLDWAPWTLISGSVGFGDFGFHVGPAPNKGMRPTVYRSFKTSNTDPK